MDMLPPQAPPAHTQTVYQEAGQSFDRLVALQSWLATEHAALPSLPDAPDAPAIERLLGELSTYWAATPTDAGDGASRRDAFAARIATAANDLAVLAHQDGAMDDDDRALVRALTQTRGALAAGIVVHEPTFDGTPYAGLLLVRDEAAGGRVLAFSTSSGWERFDSMDVAYDLLESRARAALVSSADLPGIARQHLVGIGAEPFVSSRVVDGAPFLTLVDRIVTTERDKLDQARFVFGLSQGGANEAQRLGDAVADALRSDYVFDAASALAQREATLADVVNEQRLARVPAAVADDWRMARDHFVATHDALASHAFPAAQGLQAFALNALRDRLRRAGVTQDAAEIDIDVENYHTVLPSSVVDFFAGGKPPSLSLVDLASRNIGDSDPVRLRAVDRQGQAIAGLTDATLRRIIREIDLHRTYPAYLNDALRTSGDASTLRTSVIASQLANVRLLANEARLSYFLPDMPKSFRFDHAYRGFEWVRAVLDAPDASRRAKVEGHQLVVSQLTYRDAALRDVFMIGVRDPRSVSTVVLYTPDAPDGVSFREFDDRQHAARAFLYAPAFREYLLDRLPMEYARIRPNGTRDFAGDRLANWVLGSAGNGDVTFTAEPFDERAVSGDIFAAMYETDVRLGERNARWLTTSSDDAQVRWGEEFQRRMVSSVLTLMKDVVTAPVHAAAAGWRLYDSVKAGDTRQTYLDFTQFYVASLWAAPGAHQFARAAAGRGFVTGRFRAAGTVVDARQAAAQKVVFEPRYRAKDVQRTGRPSDEGIYTIGGRTYVDHDGAMYGVRFDAGYGTWRLSRPNGGPTAWGPAIARGPMGGWAFQRVGLRGGSGRAGPSSGTRHADLFDDYLDEAERAFPDPVEREHVSSRMRAELADGVPAAQITAAQRLRWTEASQRARDRAAARDPWAGGVPRTVAEDLTTGGLPAGLRRVLPSEVPNVLHFYDRLPFKESRLVRPMYAPNHGYQNHWGRIRTELIADGFPAVRATTLGPNAPFAQIEAAMGFAPRAVVRTKSFAVSFNTDGMVRALPHTSRPAVDVYAPTGGPAGTFYLVPSAGGNELSLHGFDVVRMSDLPRQ